MRKGVVIAIHCARFITELKHCHRGLCSVLTTDGFMVKVLTLSFYQGTTSLILSENPKSRKENHNIFILKHSKSENYVTGRWQRDADVLSAHCFPHAGRYLQT